MLISSLVRAFAFERNGTQFDSLCDSNTYIVMGSFITIDFFRLGLTVNCFFTLSYIYVYKHF